MTAKIRKSVYILLCLFCITSGLKAQSSSEKENSLITAAEQYLQLANNGSWNDFIESSYPGYVQYYGGKTRLIKLLNNSEKIAPAKNSVKLHFISQGKDHPQAVLSYLNVAGDRIFMLASSSNKGNSWSYFSLPEYLIDHLHNIMPDASDKIAAVIHTGYAVDYKIASN